MNESNKKKHKNKISIIIPVYFNVKNIPITYQALQMEIKKFSKEYNYEIIFVEDGSGDDSFLELLKVYDQNPDKIRIIKFSRNFGQVAAIQAGFQYAAGDAIVVMSADLQDPPDLIPKFIEEWSKNNFEIVIAIRENRDESTLVKLFSKIFYSLMKKYVIKNIPKGGFDYFLISRKVSDIIVKSYEKNMFLQGQILWTGFKMKFIPYIRRRRTVGRSQWTFSRKIKYLIDGFITHSYFPIRFMSVLGIFIALSGFIYALVILTLRLTKNIPLKGWAPLMIIVLMLSGFQMLMLGVIGEYLWRNYDETKKRPIFIIEKIIEKKIRNDKEE